MGVVLTPQLEELIKDKVASGDYDDASAVIREALELLEERDQRERLLAALAIGQQQLDRGDVVEYTPGLLEQIRQEAKESARNGQPMDPDVLP
jgi:antitoxin ParD1/3/4